MKSSIIFFFKINIKFTLWIEIFICICILKHKILFRQVKDDPKRLTSQYAIQIWSTSEWSIQLDRQAKDWPKRSINMLSRVKYTSTDQIYVFETSCEQICMWVRLSTSYLFLKDLKFPKKVTTFKKTFAISIISFNSCTNWSIIHCCSHEVEMVENQTSFFYLKQVL